MLAAWVNDMKDAEFDQYAGRYDAEHQRSIAFSGCETSYFARYKVEITAHHFRSLCAREEALLDFGCGPGTSIAYFRSALPEARLVAADVSGRSLAEARERYPGEARYMWIDGTGLDLADGEIGMAFSACVFHHIPQAEQMHWMRELHRVVRPGGGFLVFEHNPLNPLTRFAVSRCAFDEDAVLLRAGELVGLMQNGGWTVRGIRYHVFFPQFLQKLRWLEPLLGRIPLGGQYSVLAVKN